MRIAVLGCGSIGRRHARNLQALGVSDLVLFDPDAEARGRAVSEAGGEGAETLEAVWELRPDAVLVASPSGLHLPHAMAGAERGCHLFIEKPLSHDLAGVRELEALAEKRGLVTMVACNMRFHPGPATVKRLLDEGRIGRVVSARVESGSYLPGWRPQQDYRMSYSASTEAGGAVLDVIHEIDLALWYLGPACLLASVTVPASVIGLETDGVAELLLGHESGALSNVHLNFVQRDYRRGCRMIGSEGTLYWDFERSRVDMYGADGAVAESHAQPEGWETNQMYLDELEHFLSCIRGSRPTTNPIAGGARALEIALDARRGQRYPE